MSKTRKIMLVLSLAVVSLLSFSAVALAEDSAVVTAITGATTGLQADALTIIGAAVGLGVVFWGAKLLWSKFKGMAK